MESRRILDWQVSCNLFQSMVLVTWCFDSSLKHKADLQTISLIAALCSLMLVLSSIRRFASMFQLKMEKSLEIPAAIQAERKRIASDLHDTLGCQLVQALSLIDTQGQDGKNHIKDILERALLDLRLVVDSMDAQDDGLVSRLARLRHRLEPALRHKGIQLHWQVSDPELGVGSRSGAPLPCGRRAQQVLAIVQECMSNAMTHANATEIWVTLEPYEQGHSQGYGWNWRLCIEDNGDGFDLRTTLADASKSGHGLPGMFRRMNDIGGDLHIHPRHGGGTQVLLRWRSGSSCRQ